MERNRNTPRAPGDEGLRGLRGATLIARFVCELAMLAALAFAGLRRRRGRLGLAARPGRAGGGRHRLGDVRGPRAGVPVRPPVRVGIELVLYGAAAAGLAAAGQPVAAVVLGAGGLVTSMLNEVQERRAGPDVRRR